MSSIGFPPIPRKKRNGWGTEDHSKSKRGCVLQNHRIRPEQISVAGLKCIACIYLYLFALLGAEIDQGAAPSYGDQTKNRRHRHGMVLCSIDLDRPHIDGLFPGRIRESP